MCVCVRVCVCVCVCGGGPPLFPRALSFNSRQSISPVCSTLPFFQQKQQRSAAWLWDRTQRSYHNHGILGLINPAYLPAFQFLRLDSFPITSFFHFGDIRPSGFNKPFHYGFPTRLVETSGLSSLCHSVCVFVNISRKVLSPFEIQGVGSQPLSFFSGPIDLPDLTTFKLLRCPILDQQTFHWFSFASVKSHSCGHWSLKPNETWMIRRVAVAATPAPNSRSSAKGHWSLGGWFLRMQNKNGGNERHNWSMLIYTIDVLCCCMLTYVDVCWCILDVFHQIGYGC